MGSTMAIRRKYCVYRIDSRRRNCRQPGRRTSMSALNCGPWSCICRCVNSCTTTYSTTSRGKRASSVLSVIIRLRHWHDPHWLFIVRKRQDTPGSTRRAAHIGIKPSCSPCAPKSLRNAVRSSGEIGLRGATGLASTFWRVSTAHFHFDRRNASPSANVAHHLGTDRWIMPSEAILMLMLRIRLRSTSIGMPSI